MKTDTEYKPRLFKKKKKKNPTLYWLSKRLFYRCHVFLKYISFPLEAALHSHVCHFSPSLSLNLTKFKKLTESLLKTSADPTT